jgi:hypothetical protein
LFAVLAVLRSSFIGLPSFASGTSGDGGVDVVALDCLFRN